MIDISVVTPVYNSPEYIAKCIGQVKEWISKSRFACEHVVVDDGSTDETNNAIKNNSTNNANFRVISLSKNMGQSIARNEGVKAAKGEWIFFLDADDCLNEAGMEEFVSLVLNKHLDFAYGNFMAIDSNGGHLPRHDYYGHQFVSVEECLRSMYKGEHFFQHSFILNKFVFELVGGYSPLLRMGEDFELCTRVLLAGYNPVYIPVRIYDHLIRLDSLSAGYRRDNSKHLEDVKSFYKLHEKELKKLGVELQV